MTPAIATVSLGGKLTEKLAAIAAAGFREIELFDTDFDGSTGSTATLKHQISDLGLNVASYFPIRDFEGMTGESRSQAFDRATQYLEIAAELGAGMVMVCSNSNPESSSDKGRIVDDLHELGQLAAERNLKVAYEALAWGLHVYDYRIASDLVRQAAHPAIGLVLDTFHILSRKLNMSEIGNIPSSQIFLVQISDAPLMDLDYLSWSRHHRVLPGQGEFSLDRFVDAVKGGGYDGVVSLECFNDQMKTDPPDIVAKAAFKSLDELWG